MQKNVIVVAGGTGKRMESDIPKQFLLLNDTPILMHTISKFYKYSNTINIILVLPEEQIDYWKKLCEKFDFDIKHEIVEGGETRYNSVKNGLNKVNQGGTIAVHDGVRPLVSFDVIASCFDKAEEKGNAIPYINIKESVRKVAGKNNSSANRDEFVIIQTPQIFNSTILKSAYKNKYREEFTDDASVVEYYEEKINLVKGNDENIKITNKIDLIYAEALLNNIN